MKSVFTAISRKSILIALAAAGSGLALASGCSSSFTSCEAARTCAPVDGAAAGARNSGNEAGDGGDSSAGSAGSDGGAGDNVGLGGGASASGAGGTAAAGTAGEGAVAGGAGAAGSSCGNGKVDVGEDCDQGVANSSTAYGAGLCTSQCKTAPFCGDKIRNEKETCDNGGTQSTALGDCNWECTGFYEKKYIRQTPDNSGYSTNLGGISGADAKCVQVWGAGYKALLVGATRRATVTPFKGDQQLDWVTQKYRYYYNNDNQLIWRTDDVSLIGVRDGQRLDVYADAFPSGGQYPWSGYAADWTTYDDNNSATTHQGTCNSWTSSTTGVGSFVLPDLRPSATELCGASSFILCVQQ